MAAIEPAPSAPAPWYQHPATGIFHLGGTHQGTAHTSCGTQFLPQSRKPASELTDPERCPECWTIARIPQ